MNSSSSSDSSLSDNRQPKLRENNSQNPFGFCRKNETIDPRPIDPLETNLKEPLGYKPLFEFLSIPLEYPKTFKQVLILKALSQYIIYLLMKM